jgi:hypothetical protein
MVENFQKELSACFEDFSKLVSTDKGDWTVKGFIDVYRNVYTISLDTKVVSKILELMIFPQILKFANDNDYSFVLTSHQNHYPDITFICNKTKAKIALDLKSTYRINTGKANGMTLGAFTGYFRSRTSRKNITFPYAEYSKHYILGAIYTKTDLYNAERKLEALGVKMNAKRLQMLSKYVGAPGEETFEAFMETLDAGWRAKEEIIETEVDSCLIDEKKKHGVDDLLRISSVVRDFDFFVQEKWKIATDRPGSGNTKNIGSANKIADLKNGTGVFTKYKDGDKIFNDFWMHYLTKDMAPGAGFDEPPYTNLETYFAYKKMVPEVNVNELPS